MTNLIIEQFQDFKSTIPAILQKAKLAEKIKNVSRIILKPNLVVALPSPTTTPIEIVAEVVYFIRRYSQAPIIIAEGSGGCETKEAFIKLGYRDWADQNQIQLVDLNCAKRIEVANPKALTIKKTKLPEILFDSFIINLPVLKEHRSAKMTCAMKNLYGIALDTDADPNKDGWVTKHELHKLGMHQSIIDLNNYIKSNFILVDASVGNRGLESERHPADPPISQIIAGFDAKEVDRYCAGLLNLDWQKIPYLV